MKIEYLLIILDLLLALILIPSDLTFTHIRAMFGTYFLFDCTLLIVDILKKKGRLK